MTALNNLMQQRERRNRREHRRYLIHRCMNVVRSLVLIALGAWCYLSRHQVQSFLTDLLPQ